MPNCLRVARLLTADGHHAEHVLDLNMRRTKDRLIRDHALNIGATIVTKDEDFVALNLQAGGGPQVVWIRWGNVRRQVLLQRFATALPEILRTLMSGEMIVELA